MFLIKNKVIFIISLISFSLIMLGAYFSPWQHLDDSLTKNRALNEVMVSPLFWAWPNAAENPVPRSFGEFFITETHWGYGDPAIPLFIDAEQAEKLKELLQSVRIRPTTWVPSPTNSPEIPLAITILFINPENQNRKSPDHVHITFYGSRKLEVNERSHRTGGKERFFEIHRDDETVFYDILASLNSEALKLINDL